MPNYISIDGGTTNTRLVLVKDGEITSARKYPVGAGAGAEGRKVLKEALRQGICEILSENNLQEKDIARILASGMITCEFGLYMLPHATVPAGIKELKAVSEEVELPEISSIPFVFMRGLKTECQSLEKADMMRGEETELMGICDTEYGKSVYALMGSHTKMIITDEKGHITDFVTFLTGELCAAVAKNTILKSAFELEKGELDGEYLVKGYEYCCRNGINEALFKVRILKNLFSGTESQVYSFFAGAVLCNDVQYVLKSDAETVVVAGNKALREALVEILKAKTNKRIVNLSDEQVEKSVSLGQIKIYETKL